jgi:hypothetical protein
MGILKEDVIGSLTPFATEPWQFSERFMTEHFRSVLEQCGFDVSAPIWAYQTAGGNGILLEQ